MASIQDRRSNATSTRKTEALKIIMLAAASVGPFGLMAGCKTENPPFDPHAIQQAERSRAQEVQPGDMPPLPTTLQSPYLPGKNGERHPVPPPATGPSLVSKARLRMPLEEIIHRAVANNLDIRVAGYQPGIDATRATEAEGRFDPSVFANSNWEHRDLVQAFSTVTSAGDKDREEIVTSEFGIRQNLESGGTVQFSQQMTFNYIHTSALSQVNPNPFVSSQLVLQLTQPLLQNYGYGVNQARITIARNNQRISLLDFKKQVEQSTADLEKAYWQLAQAEKDLEIDEKLLENTIHTADVLLKRMGQDVTRVQISQANASVESRRATLIRDKAHIEDLSDQLKRLMNDPEMPVSGGVTILPADALLEQPVHFDLTDEISTAMVNRFELGEQQIRIDSANVAADVAKNNELPTLNLVGQVGYQDLGDDFESSFHNQMEFNHLNYQIGLQFEYPLGNRAAKAVTRRARLQQMQAIDQYKNQVDIVALDVKTALREVETTWNEMAARRQARFAQFDSLTAIEQREAGGEPLTPTFVNLKLQTQEELAQAARDETEAVANYNIAISRLELAKGTLLRYNNVLMEEEKLQLQY